MSAYSACRPRGTDSGAHWISYSDMMAGMLFVFALILFMAVYQIVDLQKKKTIELQTKEAQLSTQQSLLLDQQAQLADKEELLASSTLLLQEQQAELDSSRAALLLAQQRIDEQTALLASQQARIDKLVGLRSEIIEALRDELNAAGLDAAVDKKTGAIAFSGAVLFDTGRNELKESGKESAEPLYPDLSAHPHEQRIRRLYRRNHYRGPYRYIRKLSRQHEAVAGTRPCGCTVLLYSG